MIDEFLLDPLVDLIQQHVAGRTGQTARPEESGDARVLLQQCVARADEAGQRVPVIEEDAVDAGRAERGRVRD